MILVDPNVVIYAFRRDTDRHDEFRRWLETAIAEEPVLGVSELILSTVVRITTHSRIFARPSTVGEAFRFAQFLLDQPNDDAPRELAYRVSPMGRLDKQHSGG